MNKDNHKAHSDTIIRKKDLRSIITKKRRIANKKKSWQCQEKKRYSKSHTKEHKEVPFRFFGRETWPLPYSLGSFRPLALPQFSSLPSALLHLSKRVRGWPPIQWEKSAKGAKSIFLWGNLSKATNANGYLTSNVVEEIIVFARKRPSAVKTSANPSYP